MLNNDIFNPLNGFQSRKAAQMAALYSSWSGGSIEKLKLIKLFYLAEREFLSRHNRPMIYDEFYSLKDGPICSAALNGINGRIDDEIWSDYIARNGNIVVPVKKIQREDCDEISNAEYTIVSSTWETYKHMSASQIRNHTHEHCSEYKEVFSGRSPITYSEVFRALGEEHPAERAAEIEAFREFFAGTS